QEKINYIVIQFPGDLIRESFFEYPEFHVIQELFQGSSRGIRFLPSFAAKAGKVVLKIVQSSGFDRVILLLKLLHELAKTNQYRLLAGELYQQQNHDFTDDRLTKVLHFLTTQYQQKVELEKL